ncbi:hypothetical protein O0L34_g7180 [Tuta absoluta]|nr:hypothetical protein O0L34_g7180 [Tuta absoluta]
MSAGEPSSTRPSSPPGSCGVPCGVPLANVLAALETFAPKQLSESWDNTGLLVEPYTPRAITKIMLTNDLTEDVALEAVGECCQMIISYHPPIFAPLKSIVQSSWKERAISFLLERCIALYSPHTCWDAVQGGVNDWLSSAFPFSKSVPIIPGACDSSGGAGRLLQLKPGVTVQSAVCHVKMLTGLCYVRFAIGRGKYMNDPVHTVALCAGSGSTVLKGACADLYLTGEMSHHDVLDAAQNGISVILTNHSDSERGFLKVYAPLLETALKCQVQVIVSNCDRDPLVTC